jgi:hypothetical protein
MSLRHRDLNAALTATFDRDYCDAARDQGAHIARLDAASASLARDLARLERKIEARLAAARAGDHFRAGSAVDVVREFSELEEDKFWRDEIEARLHEHLDELEARRLLRAQKEDRATQSAASSPARRDAAYALHLYEVEREFELATRRRVDADESSRELALRLQAEEEAAAAAAAAAGQGEAAEDKQQLSRIGRLLSKLRRGRAGRGKEKATRK